VLARVFLGCQLFTVALFVVFIVGSLLFTGGRVLKDGETIYDEVWRWPVFPVSAWLLIVPAALTALVVVPMVVTTPAREADRLIGYWGQTTVAVGAGVGFAVAFPADSGRFLIPNRDDLYWGASWPAAALSAFCFVVLPIGMAFKLRAYERLRKADDLA
jgi:hypothetical protein